MAASSGSDLEERLPSISLTIPELPGGAPDSSRGRWREPRETDRLLAPQSRSSSKESQCSVHSRQEAEAIRDEIEDSYALKPYESVYSYFLHMPPIEYERTGTRLNWVSTFAITLVVLNFVMQYILLIIVSDYVLEEHETMIHSILHQESPPWYALHSRLGETLFSPERHADKCRGTDSLCHKLADGRISCAPPSIAMLGNWDVLDTDGDGVWSREEAEDPGYRELTRCEYNVDAVHLYHEVLDNLRTHRRLDGRVHPMIVEGGGIPKAYFDWFVGEPLMCVYGDADMCGNLFQRGVFDGAIRHNASYTRGIKDFSTAFDYCLDLLENRCEHILPHSYRGWRELGVEKCGKKIFSPAEYRSPEGGPMQAIMKVDFDRRQKYENAYGYAFLSFLAVLLFVFLSTMLEEWKLIYRVSLFITQYDQLDNVLYGSDVKDRLHKPILVAVNILRFLLWVLLLYSGIIFLTSGTDYVGLIFDAVSLVFIIQLDELLYSALLRGPMKEDHGDSPPCHIHRYRLPISVLAAEFLMVVFLMVAAVWIAFMNRTEKLGPLSEALNCVCLIDGGRCDEAIVYSPAWWTDYWGKVLPASSAEIDRMMHTEMTWSVSGN